MSARLVSTGAGDRRALVLAYLISQALDVELRAALPGACIIAHDDADGEPMAASQARASAAIGGAAIGELVLIGFSAGCLRGVRAQMLAGVHPDAVIAIDGTHASLPAETWQIGVWRDLFDDARRGLRLFVATHTFNTYVETLPPGQRYQSTVETLRQVTGWPLAEGGQPPLGEETSLGDAHVHSYASAAMDGHAHGQQELEALPAMLRRYLAPWLERRSGAADVLPPTDPAPTGAPPPTAKTPPTGTLRRGDSGPAVSAWQTRLHELGEDPGAIDGSFGPVTEAATISFQHANRLSADGIVGDATRAAAAQVSTTPADRPTTTGDLAAALLEQAQIELAAGVYEDLGHNDGRAIRVYVEGTGATPPISWCAAFVRWCLRTAAAHLGVRAPIAGSLGAKSTMRQLQIAGRWIDAAELRAHPERLHPGMIVVWDRSDSARPETSWWGHVGIVATSAAGTSFRAVEGNSGPLGDRVADMPHDLHDPRLLGAGWVN